MADLRSIVYSRDASPNFGAQQPRPLARAFVFKTEMALEQLVAADAIRTTELTNAAVGEDVIVYGPGYVRMFTVADKTGDFVQLQRIGTEDGPDRVVAGASVIQAGEVGLDINVEANVSSFDAKRVSLTLIGCDVPYWVDVDDDATIKVDIETASQSDIEVLWQVFP